MKKYYLIKLCFDHAYWDETTQSFRGFNYATKYYINPLEIQEKTILGGGLIAVNSGIEVKKASQKKPITIVEVYENE